MKPRNSATGPAFYSSLYFNTVLFYGVVINGFGLAKETAVPTKVLLKLPLHDVEEAFSDQDNKLG